jgi:hypothetical protein
MAIPPQEWEPGHMTLVNGTQDVVQAPGNL